MDLTWRNSVNLARYHAADKVRLGLTLADGALQAVLAEPVAALDESIREERLDPVLFWRNLVPLAADVDAPRPLAEVVLTRLQGRSEAAMRIPRFQRHMAAIQAACRQQALPAAPDQVEPWQTAWNRSGPGLLAGIVNWTDPNLLVGSATIFVLPPLNPSGGGAAHLPFNSIRYEAVGPDETELPEVLRLAWLLSQLNLDLPAFSEEIPPARLDPVAALALVPATLSAAEPMQLAVSSEASIAAAISRWLPQSTAAVEVTTRWWETYRDRRPPWALALRALNELL